MVSIFPEQFWREFPGLFWCYGRLKQASMVSIFLCFVPRARNWSDGRLQAATEALELKTSRTSSPCSPGPQSPSLRVSLLVLWLRQRALRRHCALVFFDRRARIVIAGSWSRVLPCGGAASAFIRRGLGWRCGLGCCIKSFTQPQAATYHCDRSRCRCCNSSESFTQRTTNYHRDTGRL
jgi:hypothetical protein